MMQAALFSHLAVVATPTIIEANFSGSLGRFWFDYPQRAGGKV
jgi:hypothetical protein